METQERLEREISLKDLFWNILFGWRAVVCFGIIFAVLLGGMKYFRDTKAYHAAQSTVSDEKQEAVLTEEEMEQVANARDLQARIEEYQNYLDTSAFMQINPYEKHILELQYHVQSDYVINYTRDNEPDYTSDVTAMYCNYIIGGDVSRQVIEKAELSISQEDFSELLKVKQNGTSIYITIGYGDEKKLEDISEAVKVLLSQKVPQLQQIGSHTLELIGESQNVVVDEDLIEKKNTISNNITTIDTQLKSLKSTMTEHQLNVLNDEIAEETESDAVQEMMKPSISKKYVVLGAFAGIFLVCIWIVCKMLFTAKLQNSEEIRSLYGVRLLGEVHVQSGRKRFLAVIDDKLMSIRNRRKKKLSARQQIKVVSANVALSCKQQGITDIYITGSEFEYADTETMNMLKRELSEQNIQIKEGANMFYDAASLKQAAEVGNILFVEQQNRSIYDEISNEIHLAKEQNCNVLGVVVLV